MGHIRHSRTKRRLWMQTVQRPLPDLRLVLYVRDSGMCWYCGDTLAVRDSTMDHRQPICRGGQTAVENLVLCCQACNTAKGHYTLEEFRAACLETHRWPRTQGWAIGLFGGEYRAVQQRKLEMLTELSTN